MKKFLIKKTRNTKPDRRKQTKSDRRAQFMAGSRVLEKVGWCGEDLTAAILGADVVSRDTCADVPMDVYLPRQKMAGEVTMTNYTHGTKKTVEKVSRLYRGVTTPSFVTEADKGFFSLNFYNGVRDVGGHRKSRIMSRKISESKRREIVAREMQYIYLVDIHLMQCLATDESFSYLWRRLSDQGDELPAGGKAGAFCETHKKYRKDDTILHLTRTFLAGFMKGENMPEQFRKTLDQTYGTDQWVVQERLVRVRFIRPKGSSFVREFPVRMIGPKPIVRIFQKRLGRQKEFMMNLQERTAIVKN